MDREGRPGRVLRRAELSRLLQLREHADLRQRRPQLVRDAGDEILPQPLEALLAPELHGGRDGHPERQEHQAGEQRQARARQSSDDELRRAVGPDGRLDEEAAEGRLGREPHPR